MRNHVKMIAVTLGVAAALSSPARAADKPQSGPMAQLKQSNDHIDRLLKQNKKKTEDAAAREEMRSIVNGLLDWEEVSRRGLASHWDTLDKAQRAEFVKLLRELTEKNYDKRLKTDLDYTVLYKNESVTGDEATVATVVKVKTKGKSTDTTIDYKMRKRGDRWLVFDIITDEVSMLKNDRTQWNKIIAKDGFDALLKKMRDRIASADKPDSPEK